MLHNHLFWMAVALFFLSAINLNVYKEYQHSMKFLSSIIGAIGLLGIAVGMVYLLFFSIEFSWWWFLGVPLVSLLSIGVFSPLFRKKVSVVLGTINILLIPFLCWAVSDLNTVITSDWFYNSIKIVNEFFKGAH